MPTERLTDKFVRTVKPPKPDDKPRQRVYLHTLERGLALLLVVSYGGSKTFRVLTYVNGKPKSRKLGVYPQMSLKEARAAARAYWENPAKFAAKAEVGSFKDIAENWFKRHVLANGLISQGEIRRHLETYVYPQWKDRPFLEIRRGDVNALLDDLADDHGKRQADAVLRTISQIMKFHQSRDEHYVSAVVPGMKRSKPQARSRILSDEEIRLVWAACEDMGSFGVIIKLALLTSMRREKIAGMRWDDVKGDVWTIPHEVREKGTPPAIKLPPLALSVIADLPRLAGNPYVFASGGGKHFNSWSQRKEELDHKLPKKMPAWVIHDLRRTARSLLSRAGVRPDISERVMGHAIVGVEGTYDRHSYQDEIADALQRLANLVTSIINPPTGNVVPIR